MSLLSFTEAYVEAALWSSTDDKGEPLDSGYDLSKEAHDKMHADCAAFYAANSEHIEDDELGGHDFWLTRCGHGSGFWDGDWPEPQATILDTAAKAFGNVDLYIGDDGLIYLS